MPNHGVFVQEQATAVSTPVVADSGVPFVVGLAPVHSAANPAKANAPILVTSWDEAVEKLGFSYDWKTYTLCEFMYSHFQLFGCQPVIFCNVLDVAKAQKDLPAQDYPVTDHKTVLPFGTIASSVKVTRDAKDYPSLGLTVTKEMGNAVLSRVGENVTDCGAYTFYKIFNTKGDGTHGHLFEVDVNGKCYGIISKKTTNLKLYFTLAGKQIDFVDKVKAPGGAGLDLSSYTGDITVRLYSCPEIKDENYPTDLTLIEEYDCHLENGHGPEYFYPDEDYTVLYDTDEDKCVIELLSSGGAYSKETLRIEGKTVKTDEVSETDIIAGLNVVEACMSMVGTIPDLICAPGYSHITTVAAVMATKAASINGLFRAKAIMDLDSGESGVREYSEAVQAKNTNNFVDENQILCWPMVRLGDYVFHLSTQLAGLMAQVDTNNGGCPYESPSNKNLQMDGSCLEDGSEVNLTLEQANNLNANGIVTALNFMSSGWTAWGNYTACYPSNTDVKDYFIPVSRMFDWVGNTVIRTFWSKLDKPMNRRLIDNVLDTCNIWLNGLVGMGYLLGARTEMVEAENPLTDLMAGIIRIHIFMTPPSPAQEINFVLEYDASYVTSALQG